METWNPGMQGLVVQENGAGEGNRTHFLEVACRLDPHTMVTGLCRTFMSHQPHDCQ